MTISRLSLNAQLDAASVARSFVGSMARMIGLDDSLREEARLAVSEWVGVVISEGHPTEIRVIATDPLTIEIDVPNGFELEDMGARVVGGLSIPVERTDGMVRIVVP